MSKISSLIDIICLPINEDTIDEQIDAKIEASEALEESISKFDDAAKKYLLKKYHQLIEDRNDNVWELELLGNVFARIYEVEALELLVAAYTKGVNYKHDNDSLGTTIYSLLKESGELSKNKLLELDKKASKPDKVTIAKMLEHFSKG